MEEYIEVKDYSYDRFVIPYERLIDWEAWLEDMDDTDLPDWAEPVEERRVIFSSYRIEGEEY